MKKEDIPINDQLYINECLCGKKFEIFTQKDYKPEYYTDIYIRCECREYVLFELPVN